MNPAERNILARFSADAVGTSVRKCNATVALVSLQFTSDHALLTDKRSTSTSKTTELDRWMPGGTRYEDQDPKEWLRSPPHNFPISHSKQKKIELVAEFEVGPLTVKAGPAQIDISGGTTWTRFSATAQFKATNAARTDTIKVTLTADEAIPDLIQKLTAPFTWKVDFCGGHFEGISGPHVVYVTYDTPTLEDDQPAGTVYSPEPLGVTLQRLDTAVIMVGAINPSVAPPTVIPTIPPKTLPASREHFIVGQLMAKFPFYELRNNPSLVRFDHAAYLNRAVGGAWAMADFMSDSGQCQAIVRFVRDILKELGIPGTAEVVYIYADRRSPYTAVESKVPRQYEERNGGAGARIDSLIDTPVTTADIGRRFPPSHSRAPAGSPSPGFNNYEACMKFTHGGLSLYFPGGTHGAVWQNNDQVLKHSFPKFVETGGAWWPSDNDPDRVQGYRLTNIWATY